MRLTYILISKECYKFTLGSIVSIHTLFNNQLFYL